MKRWPLQLRRSMSDGMSATSNGTSLQQPDMSLIPERTLPSSPSPSLYSPHAKVSGFMKGSLGQTAARKQLMGGHSMVDNSRGLLHWAQSISFISVSLDHTLQLVLPADSSSPGMLCAIILFPVLLISYFSQLQSASHWLGISKHSVILLSDPGHGSTGQVVSLGTFKFMMLLHLATGLG